MMQICRLLLIATLLTAVYCLFLLFGWWTLLLLLLVAKRGVKRFRSYGTARWADTSDLNSGCASEGLLIGRLSAAKRSIWKLFDFKVTALDACMSFFGRCGSSLIRVPNIPHWLICAPTGTGKGAAFVITHGLTCTENTIFLDVKGEIYKAVARIRKNMGHRIVILDPWHVVTETPDTLNVLDSIGGDSPFALDDARAVAESLVVRSGQEREPHFNDAAEIVIAAITAFVVHHAPPEDRSLQTVRDLVTNPEELEAAINVMRQSSAWNGMLARAGNQLTHFRDKELSSTLTTTGRFLRFLDTPAIYESTARSSFDPADLLHGKMSVFMVVPPEYLRTQSPLLRLWISSFMRSIIRGGLRNERVHFVLDEAGSLGPLPCVDDALDKYRGYGVRLQLIYQSLGQLKKCFADNQDQTVLSNCGQIFFAVNDLPTAEYVSSRLGDETLVVSSGGTSTSRTRQTQDHGGSGSTSISTSSNDNWQQIARRLLKPEEVLALDQRTAIAFVPGLPPIKTQLVRYYEKEFRDDSRPGLWLRIKMFAASLDLFVIVLITAMCLMGVNIRQCNEVNHERVVENLGWGSPGSR